MFVTFDLNIARKARNIHPPGRDEPVPTGSNGV